MGYLQVQRPYSEGGVTEAMRSFVKSRSFFLVLGLSAILVIGMWLLKWEYYDWYHVTIPANVQFVLSMIELPAFAISAAIGGNPDYPVFVVYYPLLFLTYMLIFLGLMGLFRVVSSLIRNSRLFGKSNYKP